MMCFLRLVLKWMSSRPGDVRTQRIEGKNENWIIDEGRGREGRGGGEEEEEKDLNYVKKMDCETRIWSVGSLQQELWEQCFGIWNSYYGIRKKDTEPGI